MNDLERIDLTEDSSFSNHKDPRKKSPNYSVPTIFSKKKEYTTITTVDYTTFSTTSTSSYFTVNMDLGNGDTISAPISFSNGWNTYISYSDSWIPLYAVQSRNVYLSSNFAYNTITSDNDLVNSLYTTMSDNEYRIYDYRHSNHNENSNKDIWGIRRVVYKSAPPAIPWENKTLREKVADTDNNHNGYLKYHSAIDLMSRDFVSKPSYELSHDWTELFEREYNEESENINSKIPWFDKNDKIIRVGKRKSERGITIMEDQYDSDEVRTELLFI